MNQGTYEYLLNTKPTGVTETFNIETLPNGSKITTSERNTTIYGTKIYLNAKQNGESFEHFEIKITNENYAEVADVRAIYEFSNDKLNFTRFVNNQKTDDELIQLPENCLIFPLMRVFQGQTILNVAKNPETSIVLIPSIEKPNDTRNLLCPTFDERRAKNIGGETITRYQEHSVTVETNVYKYFTKHYDENSRFWINNDGLLVAYRFAQSPDKIWEVFLTESFNQD
jgi:hypothetical protein